MTHRLGVFVALLLCLSSFSADEPKLTPDEIRFVKAQYRNSVDQSLSKAIGAYAGNGENGGWIVEKDSATWIRSTHGGIVTETYSFDPQTDISLHEHAIVIRLTFHTIKTDLGDKYGPDKNGAKLIVQDRYAEFRATDTNGNAAFANMYRDDSGNAEKYQAEASKRAKEFPDEHHAIEVAKADFKRRNKDNDSSGYEFSATKHGDGWSVTITVAPHIIDEDRSEVIPGGINLEIDKDWNIVKYRSFY